MQLIGRHTLRHRGVRPDTSLHSHALLYKQDTGIDGLYMGFPFLLMRDGKPNTKPRIAPVLLWPVIVSPEVPTASDRRGSGKRSHGCRTQAGRIGVPASGSSRVLGPRPTRSRTRACRMIPAKELIHPTCNHFARSETLYRRVAAPMADKFQRRPTSPALDLCNQQRRLDCGRGASLTDF